MLAPMIDALRYRPFRLQFIAQSTSAIGSSLAPVAIAFGVMEETDSARDLGYVLAAYTVPMLALMLVGGVFADRLPRHRVMMSADLVAGAMQITFGVLLLCGQPPLWAMISVQLVNGAAAAMQMPAVTGLTSATVPAALRQQANALLTAVNDLSGIVGPLMAGLLTISVGPGWALVVDGGSFLVSGSILARLRLPTMEREPSTFLRDVRDGIGELVKREWLWSSLVYFAGFNFFLGVFTVVGPTQMANRDAGAFTWGTVLAAMSVGMFAGSTLATRVMPRYLLRWARLLELVVIPMIIGLALQAPAWVLAVCALAMGVAITFPDVLWLTALQQEVDGSALSRVSSLDYLLSFGLRPVGYAVAPVLATVGGQTSLIVVAVVFAAVTLASMLSPGVWNLARALPPHSGGQTTEQPSHASA